MVVVLAVFYFLKLANGADDKWTIYVNEANRSTEVPGVLSPLLLLNWTNSQGLSSDDKLQMYREWYAQSIELINNMTQGNATFSDYRRGMFCYPGPPLSNVTLNGTVLPAVLSCRQFNETFAQVIDEVQEFFAVLNDPQAILQYVQNLDMSSIQKLLSTERERLIRLRTLLNGTGGEFEIGNRLVKLDNFLSSGLGDGPMAQTVRNLAQPLMDFALQIFPPDNSTVNVDVV